jgi:hypothetical protein
LKLIGRTKNRSPKEIDLHGLYVKEAIAHTDAAIQIAKQRGEPNIHLIVGPSDSQPQLLCCNLLTLAFTPQARDYTLKVG